MQDELATYVAEKASNLIFVLKVPFSEYYTCRN